MTSSPRRIEFGSLLKYWPPSRRTDEVGALSRRVCYGLKGSKPVVVRRVVDALSLRRGRGELPFGAYFDPDVTLVPAPRSKPQRGDALWPTRVLCERVRMAGLGADVVPYLRRTERVAESKSSSGADRPGLDTHLRSIEVEESILPPNRITVVDDVVTRGATLLACKILLEDAFPGCEVNAFAFVRTVSERDEEEDAGPRRHPTYWVLAPVLGTIDFRGGNHFERTP